MKKIGVLGFLLVLMLGVGATFALAQKSSKALCRSWIMSKMDMEGKQYSEEMVERQQRSGVVTILQFMPNGACYIKISSPKTTGKTTKLNRWKLLENDTQLLLQPEEQSQAQIFQIVKLTPKLLVLSIEENGSKSIFHYKAFKEK